jgi:hypothetical protein
MSEIRVDYIKADKDSISLEEGTKFSGAGAFGLPGGNTAQRPEVPKEGQVRYINGDVKKGLEYYNGTEWVTVGVANGSVPEGTTPIGVFGGGFGSPTYVNTIDYITIATTGNATDFGDLTQAIYGLAACSSSTRGVFGGGYTNADVNTIEYITITTTGNATTFGQFTQAKGYFAGACSSSTRGVFGGGFITGTGGINAIDFITIATIGNATSFGQLTQARWSICGGCSSSTRGVFGGGALGNSPPWEPYTNTIDFITIATTGNATDFGDLSQETTTTAACSSSTRGVFSGGYTPTVELNTISYVTIATTGNAQDFGDLFQARWYLGACSSSTRGVFGGGDSTVTPTTVRVNTIEYITIASTGNASDFGDLTVARRELAALSNSHGGLLTS